MHLDPLVWGDVATWITGIATIALFVIGFMQIRNERLARLKSEQEAENRTARHQAEQVSCWVAGVFDIGENRARHWIVVQNQSAQPVYEAVVSLVQFSREGNFRTGVTWGYGCIAVVPPGQGYVRAETDIPENLEYHSAEIGFRDAAGGFWRRDYHGELHSMDMPAIGFFEVKDPIHWRMLMTRPPELDNAK